MRMTDVSHDREHRDFHDVESRPARRILGEFQEMPGLALTITQATKLFGIPRDLSLSLLSRFVEEGLLRITIDGRYARGAGQYLTTAPK